MVQRKIFQPLAHSAKLLVTYLLLKSPHMLVSLFLCPLISFIRLFRVALSIFITNHKHFAYIVASAHSTLTLLLFLIFFSSHFFILTRTASPGGEPNNNVKTSTATITLKSATLPRRKPSAKTEIQLEIKPRIVEQPNMRFTTEMQHPVADLRSAPPREGPAPYSPIKTMLNTRATSLEPKEHIIPIQRPQAPYARTTSNTTTRLVRDNLLNLYFLPAKLHFCFKVWLTITTIDQ